MPGLNNKDSGVQIAEELFESDDIKNCNSIHTETLNILKTNSVTDQVKSLASYQEVLLLTELHLIFGDTGPLSASLRKGVAEMAVSKVPITKAEKHIICGNKGENEKNVRKLVALQKVNRIMNNKPWAINRFHIEELRSTGLSISEIMQALLTMAHFRTNTAIDSLSSKLKERVSKPKPHIRKRNSLINGRIEIVGCTNQKSECEHFIDNPTKFCEERYMLDERLCGITCQRYWDDFGFSVLNCLDEQASLLLDNRFACLQDLRNSNDASASRLYAFWKYSQKLLGFEIVDNEKITSEFTLDEDEKELVYKLCFASDEMDDYSISAGDSVSMLNVIMVQETKLQSEIVYALHAVTQFMNW